MNADDLVRWAEGRIWTIRHVVAGLVVSTVAAVVVGGAVLAAGGWDPTATVGTGSDPGRAASDLATGGDSAATVVPLWATALLQIPVWAGLLGVPWFLVRRHGRSWAADLGLVWRTSDILPGLGIGMAAQAVLVPLLYLPILLLTDDLDVSGPARDLVSRAHGPGIVLLVLVVVVGAPVIEEVFFRGLTLRAFETRWHPRVALVASSLVFGLIHLQVLQFPALAMFGLLAGWLAQRQGDLGRAVWAHIGFNAWTVGVLVLA